jgi:hypothetical protein
LADVDGDGRLDLLTGSDNCCDKEPGFFWFRRERDGRLVAQPKVRVRVADDSPQFMSRLRVALADWEGDGQIDIVAAQTETSPALYHSRGAWSVGEPVAATLALDGSPEWVATQPCFIDWDLDGRLDLVYEAVRHSQDGTGAAFSDVMWQRNTGATGAPRLSKPCRLTTLPAFEMATGLSVGDWDSDRWPDLIVGYIRGKVVEGSYRYVAAGIRVYPRRFASPREPAKADETGAKPGL